MKKIPFIIILLILFAVPTYAVATGTDGDSYTEPTTADMSTPRLMITSFNVDGDSVKPGEKTQITIIFKNTNGYKSIRNAKLSVADATGELEFEGMGTVYVSYIGPGSSYTWSLAVSAAHSAATGRHEITVEGEYEDIYYSSYHSSDTLSIDVKQPPLLDFDNAVLPVKVISGDTVTVSVNLMNTGKCTLSNIKLDYNIKGLTTGGSTFIGELPAGESKNAGTNFRVSADTLGKTEGTLTISYEDSFGQSYTKTVTLSTVIEEKTELPDETPVEDSTIFSKIKWWIWVLIGFVVGGLTAFGITAAVYSSKIRKADELRL